MKKDEDYRLKNIEVSVNDRYQSMKSSIYNAVVSRAIAVNLGVTHSW